MSSTKLLDKRHGDRALQNPFKNIEVDRNWGVHE
jgi:hypothetical protein